MSMDREELLRSARNLYENPGTNEALKVVLEETYPELKESEDEKIRKFIIDCIDELRRANADNAKFNGRCSEAIAYLEKQKEQQPAEWSEEDELEHDYLCKLLRETWDKVDKGSCVDDAITWLENLPERIYPHSWKPSEEQVSILGKVFAGCELNTSERDSMVDLFYHLKDMI